MKRLLDKPYFAVKEHLVKEIMSSIANASYSLGYGFSDGKAIDFGLNINIL